MKTHKLRFSRFMYTAGCIAEALQNNQPQGIPANVLKEAIEFFESALRAAQDHASGSNDFENYAIASEIVRTCIGSHDRKLASQIEIDERIQSHLNTLNRLGAADTVHLRQFFENLTKRADSDNYMEAMEARCGKWGRV